MPYPPASYIDDDPVYTDRIVDTHGFALLTCASEDGPLVTHLPMIREGEYLYGHVSAENPMVDFIGSEMVFLAVFRGPHDYVSAKLYDAPENAVPTWDYTAVHVHGTTRALSAEETVDRMAELAEIYESEAGWQLEDAATYAARLFPHILYFEMRMDRVRGLRKTHRNKPDHIQSRIADHFRQNGNPALAEEIERNPKG